MKTDRHEKANEADLVATGKEKLLASATGRACMGGQVASRRLARGLCMAKAF